MESRRQVGRGGGRKEGRRAGPRVTARRVAATAVTFLAVTVQPGAPAAAAPACESARCAALPAVTVGTGPYAMPLAALSGQTLAQYLADHHAGAIA